MEVSTMTENPVYSQNSPESTSSEVEIADCNEPVKKKQKIADSPDGEKLEERLTGILCCTVCLDLPSCTVYQCVNGHLMCAGCFTHLLADARLKDERATCPNCRCEISKNLCSRNLAVEKAVSELPVECQHCSHRLPRITIEQHERNECQERMTACKYKSIGCSWEGRMHECADHEKSCTHPNKLAVDVMGVLEVKGQEHNKELKIYRNIVELLSYEKIFFHDLQLRPNRTEDFITKLYYDCVKFPALNTYWMVKASVNDDERNPSRTLERRLTFQLIAKGKLSTPLDVHYLILNGPCSDAKINPQVYRHEFSDENAESPFNLLPLVDSAECNKLLATKVINLRLILFQVQK